MSLAWRRYWLRDPFFGALDYLLHYGLRLGPIASCSAVGWALGVTAGRWRFKAWSARARDNIQRLTGAVPDQGVLDSMWGQIGRTMSEFAVLDRLWPAGRVTVTGEQHIIAARAAGRPVVVMGVHLSNWEVIAPTLTRLVDRLYFIYQPPRNRFQHAIAVRARRRCGPILLPPSITSTRRAYDALVGERASLLIFVDEVVKGRVAAPAFGRPARPRGNLANVVRLARASDAVVIPAYVERRGGARFHVVFEPPVELGAGEPGAGEGRLAADVARLDALITPIVLARLDQWFMLHDFRFDR